MYFLLWFTNSRKNSTIWFFLKRMVPIIYLGHGDPKGCVFRKSILDNFCNENSWVPFSDLHVLEKIASFNFFSKWIVPFIYLGNGDTKSCVFWKTFFDNFCNDCSCVSYYDSQIWEKIAPFVFACFETNVPNHLFRPWRPQRLCS